MPFEPSSEKASVKATGAAREYNVGYAITAAVLGALAAIVVVFAVAIDFATTGKRK